MKEALRFGKSRIMRDESSIKYGPNDSCDIVEFTDGSAVACRSSWSGPYSEVTPDIDAEIPRWWIGTPTKGKP